MYRLDRAASLDAIVVATSDHPADDRLADYCRDAGYPHFRGSLSDVLARLTAAAESHGAQTVVRVTADCPLIDPQVVDTVVQAHLSNGCDFTANRLPPPHPRTFPVGLDVEVATVSALRTANAEATSAAHREHVMPYLYENPDRFSVQVVEADVGAGTVRWTIDTIEDLDALRLLLRHPGLDAGSTWKQFLAAWEADPKISGLNAHVAQRSATAADPRSPG